MIWTSDDEMSNWLMHAAERGGGFVRSFAETVMRADDDNYRLLRPALIALKEKYPRYNNDEESGDTATVG
jgi:hypothetical protein